MKDYRALCDDANQALKAYCMERNLQTYSSIGSGCAFSAFSIGVGDINLMFILNAMIEENKHLRFLINDLMEPHK